MFPQLIAGPIVYHNELIPQLREKKNHKVNYENLSKGIYAFALGMAKKVLIADTLSKIVNVGYANVSELNSISTVIIMVCYSFQIYFDFSGYCDMAYGIGFLFNIELPVNFNSPYKAVSVRDFWDRWHMTLTRFFTKYVYIPLGGSRKGNVRTYVNVMIVFFVSGIWHGANWTFILWGIINGFGNLFDRLFEKALNKIPKMIRRTVTFCFCCIAWSLFRAESVEQGLQMLKNLLLIGSNEIYSTITDVFNNLLEVKIIGRLIGNSFIQTYPGLILFIFLAYFAKDIVDIILKIGGTPYKWIMNAELPPLDFANFNSSIVTILGVCSNGAVSIIALILVLILAWNYIKLLFEAAERYVLLGVLVYTAPVAFSMGASQTTGNIFKSWCRMLGGQIFLLLMNAWCLRLFTSMVGAFLSNPLSV